MHRVRVLSVEDPQMEAKIAGAPGQRPVVAADFEIRHYQILQPTRPATPLVLRG